MLCYNLYYGYYIKKNLPFDFVTFSVTDMLILPDLHRFLLIVTPKTMCLLKNVQCQRNL